MPLYPEIQPVFSLINSNIMGFIFKVLVALFDTPVIYGVIHLLKGKVDIAPYQEG